MRNASMRGARIKALPRIETLSVETLSVES
jgi:hypothetical protein